jgi:hypothetical protein
MEIQILVSVLFIAGAIRWLASYFTRHLNYRASCRTRLRGA